MPRFGEPGAPPRGPGRQKVLAEYVKPDEGVSEVLADMQHVYRNSDKRHDVSGGQKFQRLFSEKSPKQFRETMAVLEREGKVEGCAVEKDEGTERCVAMARKLIQELGGG